MRFEKQTFQDQTINLDDNQFFNCKFVRCRIMFKGCADVTIHENGFDACTWHFEGPAARTVNFMAAMHRNGGDMRDMIDNTLKIVLGGPEPSGPVLVTRPRSA